MENNEERILAFSIFVFNTSTGELLRKGKPLRLPTQAASVLTVLAENSGTMVSREELRALLWPNGEVTDYDQSINRVVSQLRSILGERPEKPPQYIDTLPKRGYRFKAEVRDISPVPPPVEMEVSPVVPEIRMDPAPLNLPEPTILNPAVLESPARARRVRSRVSPFGVASGVLLLLLAVAAWLTVRRSYPKPASPPLTLGIVPFETSGDDAQMFAESLRLDLADTLAQIPGVEIRAAHAFDNAGDDEAKIRRHALELGVSALLFGKFSIKDNQCTLQLELVRSEGGVHLSSFHYVGTRDELAKIEDQVQRDIFLRLAPSGSVKGIPKSIIPSPKAYDAYLRGRYDLSQWTDGALLNAVTAFQESLQQEPDYARAYAGKASAYFVLAQHGAITKEAGFREARANANKALSLDRSLAEPYAILGQIALHADWNFQLAEEQLLRAVEMDPHHAMYRLWLSILYCDEGRFKPALQQIDLAHAADSSWAPIYMTEIFVAATAQDFARANAASLKLNQTMPSWPLAHEQRAMLLWNVHQYVAAIAEWKAAAALEKNTDRMALEDAGLDAFQHGGVPAYARVRLHALETRRGVSHEDADFIPAEWHAYAGDLDLAMTELEEMVRLHSQDALQVPNNPAYQALHGSPRFERLTRSIGLPL